MRLYPDQSSLSDHTASWLIFKQLYTSSFLVWFEKKQIIITAVTRAALFRSESKGSGF